MKSLIDVHTHTIVSGHAYSTILENLEYAKKAGLKYLGLSEHGPMMPGAPHMYYFCNIHCVPREINGIRILRGAEANILNTNGDIDLKDIDYYLDYLIASLHPPCIKHGSIEENTKAVINAMNHEKVKIIGHLDDSRYLVDYEEVVKYAKEKNVVFEINNSSLKPTSFRQGARENVSHLLKYCKKYGVGVILGSDAHICFDVGGFKYCEEVLEKNNFDNSLVLNYNEGEIIKFFGID